MESAHEKQPEGSSRGAEDAEKKLSIPGRKTKSTFASINQFKEEACARQIQFGRGAFLLRALFNLVLDQ